MLVLFDIDGTLLLTHGEGMRAMQDAGRELYHPGFSIDGVDFSGRLDPLIWKQLCEMNGVETGPNDGSMRVEPGPSSRQLSGQTPANEHDAHARFRAVYEKHLRRRLDNGARVTLLPGVRQLLEELRAMERMTLGLVTGNYPETGRLKIERAGVDFSMFSVFGWGCDGVHRRDLPASAIRHCFEVHRRAVRGEEVVIIGDTPHDIDCAKHNGCRSIAVATGAFSKGDLQSHHPDLAVDDLSDTLTLMRFIQTPTERISP
jgi:phosphoglycolate phosphatase-like HAD superfamily hydrolase